MGKVILTVDGNTAAAYVAYAFTEVAAVYPITPSSTMAELVDEWSANGKKNLFGQTVKVIEMQSEAGASGALHGALEAGTLASSFTASQGLLLMIPNLYKISGELLPGVLHVSARAIAAQALSIFGDQQDVMAVRQTGCVMLASSNVQEVMDLALVAHLSAIKGRLPFIHFFDGFRTSHEIQKIEALEYEDFVSIVDFDAINNFRKRALSPNHPVTRGTAQNPDIYFQTREACNPFYEAIVQIVEDYMNETRKLTGRKYSLFDYYGALDAEYIIVAMGSVCDTIEETIETLNSNGKRYGAIKVHLYRPFSKKHFLEKVPKTVKKVAVLDRTKEPGALGEPLYLDVCNCFYNQSTPPIIIGGRYGLGSKDTTPNDILAIFNNLEKENIKDHFTIGILDDVTNTSLSNCNTILKEIHSKNKNISCKFYGLGSDGTVGANKMAIKLIGEHTNQHVQAYFSYDSKKSGGLTVSHLRFGNEKIRSAYLIQDADYIACHNQSYVYSYDLLKDIKDGGIFVLNTHWTNKELEEKLPKELKQNLVKKKVKFYCIDAIKIASLIGLGNRISMIMQGVFFRLVRIIDDSKAKYYLEESIKKMFAKKGEDVVRMNCEAINKGFEMIREVEVQKDWIDATLPVKTEKKEPDFVKNIMRPILRDEGNKIPVSAFLGAEDGTFPAGTSKYEKRGIAIHVPKWKIENCIQCNQCAFICPHACIRPFLLSKEEQNDAPASFKTKQAVLKDTNEYGFRIQISEMDCTGCGNCADICPAKEKALVMEPFMEHESEQIKNWEYAIEMVSDKSDLFGGTTVRDSQFKTPLMEFSGACGGCGETPYIKVVTQLFGERMMIANATGCSSIWGASAPSTPYTCNHELKGPSWANSLFEDNAEYGFGMYMGVKQMREGLKNAMDELLMFDLSDELRDAVSDWIKFKESGNESKKASNHLMKIIDGYQTKDLEIQNFLHYIQKNSDYLIKRSHWMIGGDGWAYDIGFGGLDHVLASGEDVNILVFDTQVYSNTGGQASKATPLAAVAKFASKGKRTARKDLGRMMMSYKNVYVAQIAMGADKNQTIKAFVEAENYNGPSLIIAYAPCISHGMKEGMGKSIENMKKAVEAGYWFLYRYNPKRIEEGKNPFILDSKEPKSSFRNYIMGQIRYSSLMKQFPKEAEKYFESTQKAHRELYEEYHTLS